MVWVCKGRGGVGDMLTLHGGIGRTRRRWVWDEEERQQTICCQMTSVDVVEGPSALVIMVEMISW